MTDQTSVAIFKALCRALALLVAFAGALVLLGWAVRIASLKSIFPGFATMKTNTALSFILAAMSLWLTVAKPRGLAARVIGQIAAVSVTAIALLTLCEYCFGWNLGIDQLLVHDPDSINRMSGATAFCFLLFGPALLLTGWRRGLLPGQWLALCVAFLSFVAILAYIFNVRDLYRVGVYSSMAIHTAGCLLLLAVGLLFARPEQGLMFVISADSQGGKLVRRSIPFIIGVPVLLGWVRLQGQNAGLYGTEFGLALFVTANVAIFGSTCWFYALRLHRADTQLRQAHEETLALNQSLEQRVALRTAELARSVAELEQFAVVASHDLQEPLRSIASYAQLLARRYREKLDPEADEFIGFIVAGATRMKRLIHDLLEYAQLGAKRRALTLVAVESALGEAVANLKFAIENNNAIVTWDELPSIAADKSLLVRLFQNLIGNAIKYRGADPPRIHIGCRAQHGSQLFSVSDNGIGIESSYKEKIFVLFQRLHTGEDYEGTGIGLAISKKIVESHDGTIWVESSPGQGSTFYFTLADEAAKAKPPPPALFAVGRNAKDGAPQMTSARPAQWH